MSVKESFNRTLHHLKQGFGSFASLPAKDKACVFLGVGAILLAGMAQIFFMNEWEKLFCNGATPWATTFTICATSVAVVYAIVFAVWCVWKRPRINFLFTKKALILATLIGFCDALDGIFIFRSAEKVPEMVQAFLNGTAIIFTFIGMKIVAGDDRSYFSPLVVVSFLLTVGGTVLASAASFGSNAMTTSDKIWTFIFELGTATVSVYTVLVYMFLNGFSSVVGLTASGRRLASKRGFSFHSSQSGGGSKRSLASGGKGEEARLLNDAAEAERLAGGEAKNANGNDDEDDDAEIEKAIASLAADVGTAKPRKVTKVNLGSHLSEMECTITIRLGMVAASLTAQLIWLWLLIPVDAIPWFGDARSVGEAYHKIAIGWEAVFNSSVCNNHNGLYAFLFVAGAVMQYAGVLYLNAYSAGVTSMVNQLVSPVSAIILLLIPAWNVTTPPLPISTWQTLVAVVLLIGGTILYSAWEESTKAKAIVSTAEVE